MSLVAPVKDGKVVDTSKNTSSKETEKSGGTLGKDAFLQLLVAQMKYQDPLEPTSNTEYISQLATFSSLEEMQNMTAAMNLQRASNLVGEEVYIKTTDATTGSTNYVHGKVNFVSYQNGKAYVNVNGENYPLDDVESIYDPEYSEAYDLAYEWTVGLNKLPSLAKLRLSDEEDVMKLKDTYDKMTDYQKTFLTKENVEKLESYVNQIELLKKAKEDLDQKLEEADKKEEGDSAEETDKTEKPEETEKPETSEETEAAGKPEETKPAEEPSQEAEETAASTQSAATEETADTEGVTETE